MTAWFAAVLLVIGVLVLLHRFGLMELSREAIRLSRQSFDVVRNPMLTDDAKQSALQHNAKRLFRLAFVMIVAGAAALGIPTTLLWLADGLNIVSWSATVAASLHPAFIAILFIVALGGRWLGHRSASGFSPLDRGLHRVAFKTYAAQAQFADIENAIYSSALRRRENERPVFITALPRAGTTLLLETLATRPEFASHTYRDMPFVLTPLVWQQFSALLHRKEIQRPRAHGDGMLIRDDSPEALEEVLWHAYWKSHYRSDRIVPWQPDERDSDDEFPEAFSQHMRKIILLRRGDDVAARYISKNNLNIARISLLKRLFPESIVVVPFRQPVQHAASLLKQHENFSAIHRDDRFAAVYMKAIGHYEFGENLRPIDFESWLDDRRERDFLSLGFWLEYWLVAYRHLLAEADLAHYVDYDALCAEPAAGLRLLASIVQIRDADAFVTAAKSIRAARPHNVDVAGISPRLLQDAETLYAELQMKAFTSG